MLEWRLQRNNDLDTAFNIPSSYRDSMLLRRYVRTILSLLLISLALVAISPHALIGSLPKAHATTRTITLFAYLAGWNSTYPSGPNPTITVNQGDTISFSLVNPDNNAHLLLIDFDNNGVISDCSGPDKCSGYLSPGGTGSIPAFTVTAGPGQYAYYCLYHSPQEMTGRFIVQGPDYMISSNTSSLTIDKGTNANSTVSVASLSDFSGQVMLSAIPPSSWPVPFFGTNPVTVSAGMTSISKLTIYVPSGVTSGSYSITITASNSTTSHSTIVSVTVPTPSFSVTPNPAMLEVNFGAIEMSTILINGAHGFSGTVSLTASAPQGNGVPTLSSTSVVLSPTTDSATSTLNITSSLGTFNVTVTATSGSVSHQVNVLVHGPDFTITASPTSLSLNQGSTATLTVALSGVNGFSGSVSLSANPSNSGLIASLSSSTLQVPATGTVTSTLTVTTSSSGAYSTAVSTGSYTITLNATMGSLSHVTAIPLTVASPWFGAGFLTNPIFIGGIVGTIALVAVAIFALNARSKRSNVR